MILLHFVKKQSQHSRFSEKNFSENFIEKEATGCIKLYVLVTDSKHGGKTMSTSLAYHKELLDFNINRMNFQEELQFSA